MNIEEVLSILKAKRWKQEEAQACIYILDSFGTTYCESNRLYGTYLFSTVLYNYEDGYIYEWVPLDEMRRGLEWVERQVVENPSFLGQIETGMCDILRQGEVLFRSVMEADAKQWMAADMVSFLFQSRTITRHQYGWSAIAETLDYLGTEELSVAFPHVPREDLGHVIETLSTSEAYSYGERYRMGLLAIAKDMSSDCAALSSFSESGAIAPGTKFQERIESLERSFFWMRNGFKRATRLGSDAVFEDVRHLMSSGSEMIARETIRLENKEERVRSDRNAIFEAYEISEKTKRLFEIIRHFSIIQDQRKESVQKQIAVISKVLDETARRSGIDTETIYEYCTEEVEDLLISGNVLSSEALSNRRAITFYATVSDESPIERFRFFREDSRRIRECLLSSARHSGESVAGFVASRGSGTVRGVVHITFDPGDLSFREGDILVTGMTRPDFVPLMKKASAIVTNEGGITTHAAIVSRELGKLCIIGTKVATQVFHDGDLVEVDADHGMVRKIA